MFSMFPAVALFLVCMVVGTLVSVSGSSWVVAWIGLEMNLLAFVPLLILDKGGSSVESGVSYFLAQVCGSTVFLSAPLMPAFNICSWLAGGLLLSGLLVKLGSAPTHQWFPRVMAGVGWTCGYLMMTWQKLGPLWLVSAVLHFEDVAYLLGLAALNGVLGAWGGLNQKRLAPLFGYSSVAHLGWMLAVIPFREVGSLAYLLIYSTFLLPPVLLVLGSGVRSVKAYPRLFGAGDLWLSMSYWLGMLNLGGMPPFMGFFLKLYVFHVLVSEGFLWVALVLAFSSVLALSYYHGMSFQGLMVGLVSREGVRRLSYPSLHALTVGCGLLGGPIAFILLDLDKVLV